MEEEVDLEDEELGVTRSNRGSGYGVTEGWSVRRSVRLKDMNECVKDIREVDVVKVEAKVEVSGQEMVKVVERLDVEGEEAEMKRRTRGIGYGGTGGWSVRRSERLREMQEAEVLVEIDETTGQAYGK